MSDALLPPEIEDLAKRVVDANRAAGRKVTVAESCTGGLVAAALTEVPGSSAVLDR
ncbi:MAG: CinA family protein, partial [Pseudomonadota bacterium]|nr:CinA family protein [Pseudomonadota bacterium]